MSPLPPLGFFAHGAAITGDYQAIMTATVDSGGTPSITFNSIPSTFKHLQVRVLHRSTQAAGGTDINMRFNSDSASNYAYHALQGNGSSAVAFGGTSQTYIRNQSGVDGSDAANVFMVSVYDILDYANTNKYKTVRTLTGYDNNGGGFIRLLSGLWQSNSAITTIELYPPSTTFTVNSSFALYGIKG